MPTRGANDRIFIERVELTPGQWQAVADRRDQTWWLRATHACRVIKWSIRSAPSRSCPRQTS